VAVTRPAQAALCGIPNATGVDQVVLWSRPGHPVDNLGHLLECRRFVRRPPLCFVTATQGRGPCSRLGQPGTGVDFPVGRNPLRLDSLCDLSVKPRFLAAWVGPHGYLSGAAISPPVFIRRQLRPKDSLLSDKRGGGTGSPRAVPSFLNHAYVTHSSRSSTQQPRTCGPSRRRWPNISALSQPASSRASAKTGRRSKARSS